MTTTDTIIRLTGCAGGIALFAFLFFSFTRASFWPSQGTPREARPRYACTRCGISEIEARAKGCVNGPCLMAELRVGTNPPPWFNKPPPPPNPPQVACVVHCPGYPCGGE